MFYANSFMLTSKNQIIKMQYYSASHWHLGDVVVGYITVYDFCCF